MKSIYRIFFVSQVADVEARLKTYMGSDDDRFAVLLRRELGAAQKQGVFSNKIARRIELIAEGTMFDLEDAASFLRTETDELDHREITSATVQLALVHPNASVLKRALDEADDGVAGVTVKSNVEKNMLSASRATCTISGPVRDVLKVWRNAIKGASGAKVERDDATFS